MPESAMSTGSITKTFTAAEVLVLADRGLVDLDAPVTDYVELPFDAAGATVRQVLNMTSGFPTDPPALYAITAAVTRIRASFQVPLGVNVHLNGVRQAIAIAVAAGCQWVRAFELANAYVSNAGVLEAVGPDAMRFRAFLRSERSVMVFGDFHVKHGSHAITADRSLEEQAEDVETALADAVIVTGVSTGTAPTLADIERIRRVVRIPVLIGSGLSAANLAELLPQIDGAIVGTSFKVDGRLENPIDVERVRRFMEKVRAER